MPQLRRPPPRPGGAASDVQLRGIRAANFTLTTPEGTRRIELPLPGLYNVYNALGAAALCLRLGVPLDEVAGGLAAVEPAFGRAETIEIGGRPTVDPARQEPRRRQRGAAHARARGDQARPVRRAQRPHGRRARRLVGVGRRLGDHRAARAAADVLGHARSRAGAAAQVRRRRPGRLDVVDDLERGLDRALADGSGPLYALPTYTALLELKDLLAAPRPRGSTGGERRRVARPRVRRLRRRPAAVGRARRRRRACSTSAPAPAAWRCAWRATAARSTALDRDPVLLAVLADRAARRARAHRRGRRRRLRRRRAASISSPCRCRRSSCCRTDARAASSAAPGAPSGAAASSRSRSPPSSSRSKDSELPPPDVAESDGTRFVSQPTAVRRVPGGTRIERLRHVIPPAGTTEHDVIVLATSARTSSPPRPPPPASSRSRRAYIDPTATTSAPKWCCCVAERTLRVCALYPDLLNIYADRGNLLLLERRCAWRGIGFELAGVRARRPARPRRPRPVLHRRRPGSRPGAVRARHGRRPSATRCTPRPPAAPSCSRSAAATSCSATATRWATSAARRRPRRSGHGARGRAAADRQRRDRARATATTLAGFENHGGRTRLGAGARRRSAACCAATATTAARASRASAAARTAPWSGTYLHGPLLPKNAHFADWLIATALGVAPSDLAPLDDALEDAAHAAARRAAGV